jgi:hypothetical protein
MASQVSTWRNVGRSLSSGMLKEGWDAAARKLPAGAFFWGG